MSIVIVGFLSSIGQVLILRELLVLFYGNELSTGLVLSGWLIWSAVGSGLGGQLIRRCRWPKQLVAFAIALLAVLLPATLLWIRASRMIWSIPPGEMASPAKMFWIALTTTGPYCLSAGFLFPLIWAIQTDANGSRRVRSPMIVYLWEAIGAAAGGVLLYFVIIPRMTVLWGASAVSVASLLTASLMLEPVRKSSPKRLVTVLLVTLIVTSMVAVFLPDLETVSRHWQWGKNVLAVRDTPFHNLAIVREENQFTFFSNGLWLFSFPDPQTAEQAVHLTMLQHPQPRSLLVLGGGASGLLGEILKHPDVSRVDYVEADPELIRLGEKTLPAAATAPLQDRRVRIFYRDGGEFIRNMRDTYDVVLLNPGDPMTAEMNRFYTVEFYRRVTRLLKPGGIISFAIGVPTDIVGPAQARFLRSVHATVRSVFPQVFIYPGENARFFATNAQGVLVTDASEITARLQARGLDLQYVRIDTLFDALNPFRLGYLASILEIDQSAELNTDFVPTCYFNDLLLWGVQLHPAILSIMLTAAGIDHSRFEAGAILLALVGAAFFWLGRPRAVGAVAVSVTVVGATLIVLEIALLLGFQILEGFVYKQLSVIIALFMAGLAFGAAVYVWIESRIVRPSRWIIGVQCFLAIYLLAVMKTMLVLHGRMESGSENWSSIWTFAALALCAGIPGGLHFSLAVRIVGGCEAPSERVGGGLYALDTLGAAVAALATSIFLLPLLGLQTTLHLFAILNMGSILALARPERFFFTSLLRLR